MAVSRLGGFLGLVLAASALAQSTPTLKHIVLNNNLHSGPYYPSGWADWRLIGR